MLVPRVTVYGGVVVMMLLVLCLPAVEPPASAGPPPETDLEASRLYWVQHWALRTAIPAPFALQVAKAENVRGVTDAWSPNGCCVGIMQINVRFHYGQYDRECGGSDLLRPSDNVCYGLMLLRDYRRWCRKRVAAPQVDHCTLGRYGGAQTLEERYAYISHVQRYGNEVSAP